MENEKIEIDVRENWYAPELAKWLPAGMYDQNPRPDPRVFSIHENAGNGRKGRLVATITVAPEFSPKDSEDIARIIGCAPDLWRTLRATAPAELNDLDGLRHFHDAVEALWVAVDRYPYEWPAEPLDEEIVLGVMQCGGRVSIPRRTKGGVGESREAR